MNLPKANSRDFKRSAATLLEWWFGISFCLAVLPLISQSRRRLRELKGEAVALEKENRELEADERKSDEKRRELLKELSEAGLHLRLVKPTDPGGLGELAYHQCREPSVSQRDESPGPGPDIPGIRPLGKPYADRTGMLAIPSDCHPKIPVVARRANPCRYAG